MRLVCEEMEKVEKQTGSVWDLSDLSDSVELCKCVCQKSNRRCFIGIKIFIKRLCRCTDLYYSTIHSFLNDSITKGFLRNIQDFNCFLGICSIYVNLCRLESISYFYIIKVDFGALKGLFQCHFKPYRVNYNHIYSKLLSLVH